MPLISVSQCKGLDHCKAEQDFDQFIQRKVMIVLTKSTRYNPEVYDESVLSKSTNIFYYDLQP